MRARSQSFISEIMRLYTSKRVQLPCFHVLHLRATLPCVRLYLACAFAMRAPLSCVYLCHACVFTLHALLPCVHLCHACAFTLRTPLPCVRHYLACALKARGSICVCLCHARAQGFRLHPCASLPCVRHYLACALRASGFICVRLYLACTFTLRARSELRASG